MLQQPYTINVETPAGVHQHGYHLGTILPVAEQLVWEQLRRPEVMSVALYAGQGHLIGIYDYRHLPEADWEEFWEH